MEGHTGQCKCSYKDDIYMISGRRCHLVVFLFYDPKDKIFHRTEKPGRVLCSMIQNTKKSFYVKNGEALNEYFFDSYEGWYIQSFHHGFKYNYTSESSSKFRQCDTGIDLNTHRYQNVLQRAFN